MKKEVFEYRTKTVSIKDGKINLVDINKKIEFEFELLAKQTDASVKVTSGGTSVLCCLVYKKEENKEIPSELLVPLIVDYRERTYAAGKIPGGFFKREGKPREHEVHVSRLIDRTLRPLFSKDFNHDIQISVLVLSFDPNDDPTILSVLGSSVVASISGIPFKGDCSCFRLCKINGEYIVNPTFSELDISDIDLIACFHKDMVLMIETEANGVEEDELVSMLDYLKSYALQFNIFQQELIKKYGVEKREYKNNIDLNKLFEINYSIITSQIKDVLSIQDKNEREERYSKLSKSIKIPQEFIERYKLNETLIEQLQKRIFFEIFRRVVREEILKTQKRYDGRTLDELRNIKCYVGVLPRAHGSAIFERGQTQALVTATLGTLSDMQIMDELIGEYKERFLFHYNFPGFATGEVKPDRGVSRREIGHGFLAKKSIEKVLPPQEEFPYTIRIVSDILESNGSSSMASVCGATLALYDAGVKIKKPVAGVAMGLIMEDDKYVVLTDISGLEDHCGDMDFKVAGTEDSITAIQLDLKITGISLQLVKEILYKAKDARKRILEKMLSVIDKPRSELSSFAPKIKVLQIPVDKIGELIGPKGKNIKQIIESTQTKIDIEEDGKVVISADNYDSLNLAVEKVMSITKDLEVGKVYIGKVKKVTNYGIFIELALNKVGLLHISQMNPETKSRSKSLSEGDDIVVKISEIDEEGRLVLTQRGVEKFYEKK